MEMTAIERQQHFIDLAASHADDFKTRVTKHDRENSFPFENIEAMKTSGYLTMTLAAELGGGGANLLDYSAGAGAASLGRWTDCGHDQHAPVQSRTALGPLALGR